MNLIQTIRSNSRQTPKMPVLFIGHGSPMNALENNEFTRAWQSIAASLPRPNSIVCISAHWETRGTFVTSVEYPKTIHDFGGFPPELYNVEYKAPGSPVLAESIQSKINTTNIFPDYNWGLDHGCWSVMKHFYPRADIPIVQISIDYTKPLSFHLELAKELADLRNKGVLVIASGNMVHNLSILNWQNPENGYDWAIEVNDSLKKNILDKNFAWLSGEFQLSKNFRMAVPTQEHYIPLLYALGMITNNEDFSFFNDKVIMGSLAMTSLIIS